MIYIIKTESTPSFIKVGYTKEDIQDRLSKIQVGCPHQITLLATSDGEMDYEKSIHKELDDHRVRGEWFKWNNEVEKVLINLGFQIVSNMKVKRGRQSKKSFVETRFRERNFPNIPRPVLLSEFCEIHGLSEDEVASFETEKTSFFIALASPFEIFQKSGHTVSSKNTDDTNEYRFIIPRKLYNLNRHYEIMEKISRSLAIKS